MTNPLSFQGPIGRVTYAAWALPIVVAQYVVGWFAAEAQGMSTWRHDVFYVFPLRMLLADQTGPTYGDSKLYAIPMTLAGIVCLLLSCWALAALTYRRMLDCRGSGWLAAAVLLPLLQLPIILILSVVPPRAPLPEPVREADRQRKMSGWGGALQGMVAGIALTLSAVALSALVFGSYGYGIFVASPFVIGAVTGYIANRSADLDTRETNRIVIAAGIFGSLALLVTALEGFGCLVMVAPLAILAAMAGGAVGGDAGRRKRASTGGLVSSVAVLPVIFALEALFPPSLVFGTEQSIAVHAPPDKVWNAIVRMETISEPVSLIHHVGIAYPVRGRVFGEGVGALRYGDFSTGTAIERVTVWEENRKLAFVVLKDIPGLRELSPYRHVHAPHVHGYFTTQETSFELIPRAGGVTEIVERTSHRLKLDPALYWLPFARYMVDTNNARVLRHIKAQAERSMLAGAR